MTTLTTHHDQGGRLAVSKCGKRPRVYLAAHLAMDHGLSIAALSMAENDELWMVHRDEHPGCLVADHSEHWIAASTPRDLESSALVLSEPRPHSPSKWDIPESFGAA